MKTNKSRLLFSASALALFGALALQGCGSDDSSSGPTAGSGGKGGSGGTGTGGKGGTGTGGTATGGKGGTGAGGTGAGGTGAGGTAGRGGTGGTAGRGGTGGIGVGGDNGAAGDIGEGGAPTVAHATVQECTNFCTLDAATCMGGNNPYVAPDNCQADCLAYPLGDDSDPTRLLARTGNNFACRAYHLQNAINNAATPNLLTLHCGHTGKVSTACF